MSDLEIEKAAALHGDPEFTALIAHTRPRAATLRASH